MNLETNYKIQKKGITLVIPNPCGNIKESKMKNSGIEWIGEIPDDWEVKPVKRYFSHVKRIVGDDVDKYERLSLTMQGVLKRSKDDAEGLQPEKFNGYQILKQNELVFKLIDLENVNTSRVGISPFNGLVSPAYIILTNNKKDNTFYYYWFLNMYYQEIFNKLGDGGVRSALNASDVLSLPMVYLNNETQQCIASYLDKKCSKIEETIQNQQQVIEKLKAYKQSLITESVTGKVKIENGKVCGEYESYKDSGVEWLGKIPSEWEVGKTGMFTYVTKLAGFEFTDIMMDKISEKGDVPIVRAQNVRMFKFNKEIINEYIDLLTSNTLNRCCLDKKCLLITFIGAGIGDICIFDESIRYHLAPNVAKIEIRNFAKTKLCEEFLMYYIGSEPGKREIANISKVAAQPSLSMETIRKIKLCIPPFEEQKLIVDYLYPKCLSIDKTIEQKQKLIVKLTEYKKSLIYECVTGKKEI